MTMTDIYSVARSLEAVENYAYIANSTGFNSEFIKSAGSGERISEGEEQFWRKVFDGIIKWNTKVEIYETALSEWIARIPGLFWTPGAKVIRKSASKAGKYQTQEWTALQPLGKSRKVMGGVGTLRFPSDWRGYRLVTLTSGLNASAGIPVLISPEVWEHNRLHEGKVIQRLKGVWQNMSGTSWAERFTSIKGIPKGFLVIEDPAHLVTGQKIVATKFHPFTVMEYSTDSSILYDFVYATADTGSRNYRSYIERFFSQYKNDNNRFGKYLLAADVEDPLWEAEFDSPESLLRADPGAKSHLELLQERMRGNCFKGRNLDDIIKFLTQRYDNDDLKRLSSDINVPTSVWYKGRSSANSAVDFISECVRREKVEELVDTIALEYSETF